MANVSPWAGAEPGGWREEGAGGGRHRRAVGASWRGRARRWEGKRSRRLSCQGRRIAMRVMKDWDGLPREAVEVHIPGNIQGWVGQALSNLIQWKMCLLMARSWAGWRLKVPPNPKHSIILCCLEPWWHGRWLLPVRALGQHAQLKPSFLNFLYVTEFDGLHPVEPEIVCFGFY